MKTIKEQIAAFEAKRQASAARRAEIMAKAAEEGRTLDDAEKEEYDGLDTAVKSIDEHLVRLGALEKDNVAHAVVVDAAAGTDPARGAAARSGIISVKRNCPPGTAFTRYVLALCRAPGNLVGALEVAKNQSGWIAETPEVIEVLKAAVAAGTTTEPTWASALVFYQQMVSEFIELLRPQTILGRLDKLRRVPFNVRMASQTSGSTAYWVGEGQPKPVSKLGFDAVTLQWAKAAGIVVLTEELVRVSTPSAEAIVRADVTAQIAQFLNEQFVNPDVAPVAGVSPGSITNGIAGTTPTGTDAAAVRADVETLFGTYLAANLNPANAVWIMPETTALALSLMLNPLGQPLFPQINMNGGFFFGLPVVTSMSAVVGGSPNRGNLMVLANQSEILVADDGQVTIDASREASLQMDSAPTDAAGSPPTATTMVSMFQTNSVAIRAERWINWKRRRPQAVAWLSAVAYR